MKEQTASLAGYLITDHALRGLKRRAISRAALRRALLRPEQRCEVRPGREVLQSRIMLGRPPKTYLVRVFVDVDRKPQEVVTVYRSSKVEKYWRKQP